MITKEELKRLEQPSLKNAALSYTIGGPVETAVHSNLESERIGKLNQGHRTMNEAVARFRNNMAFRSREGFAKNQFQQAQQGDLLPVDTDAGYGAGNDNESVECYVSHSLNQREAIQDERVKTFAKTMTSARTQYQDLDR